MPEVSPLLLLTTTGWRSGAARVKPLGYLEEDGAYSVCGSAGGDDRDPGWAHNLRSQPSATVELGDHRFAVTASEVVGDAYEPLWQRFSGAYPHYANYAEKTGRRFPMFWLSPTSDNR